MVSTTKINKALETLSEVIADLKLVKFVNLTVDQAALLNARSGELDKVLTDWKDQYKDSLKYDDPLKGKSFEVVKKLQDKTYTDTKSMESDMGHDWMKSYKKTRQETHLNFSARK